MKHSTAFLAVAAVLFSADLATGDPAKVPGWQDVSAIFVKRCVNCHSEKGAGLDLRLDSYELAIAGSRKGPVLVAGNPDESELVRRLLGISTPRMPFLGRPLPDDELDAIVRWIEEGMPEESGGQ